MQGMTGPSRERQGIFISYRRADSQSWTGRLVDDLREYFGRDRVYLDIDSNRSAHDYVIQIEEALIASRVMVAVIGPNWFNISTMRLQDPDDFVRIELERALTYGMVIVPVLVGGTAVPALGALPSPLLQHFARLQMHRLADQDWHYDFGRLLDTLERNGVLRSPAGVDTGTPVGFKQRATDWAISPQRFERKPHATRLRGYDAVTGAIQLLNYTVTEHSVEGAHVTFRIWKRDVTAKVVDVGPGWSTVVVEFASLDKRALATVSVAAAAGGMMPVAMTWPVLRRLEKRFAAGFLDNVVRVLEGRGIGEDSSLFPGVHSWRNRSREV